MTEYKITVVTPGKGSIVVKIVANSDMAAIESAKAMGGPGAYCCINSRRSC